MKRALIVVVILAFGGLIAFLAVTKNMAEKRADKLDKALMKAEGRLLELDGDVLALEEELAEAKEAAKQAPSQTTAPVAEPAKTEAAAPSATATPVAAETVRYVASAGAGITNQVRIEGTSSMHDWRVVGGLIGGSVEFPAGFTATAGTANASIPVKGGVFIPVRSMKSMNADGKPYSDAMDEIMYGKLLVQEHPRITFTVNSLENKGEQGTFEASGQLVAAGKTNTVTMPVTVLPLAEGKLQISGSVKAKMTDFGIEPPAPGPIRTGDDVTLKFIWTVRPLTSK